MGPEVEAICQQAIELRYQLLPYLYSLFWESSQTRSPILRPLLYEFPADPQTYDCSDQAMLGSALLAAPALRPGLRQRAVYLPEGAWFDWWTGQLHCGPTHILAEAPLDRLPLFVRAGSLIPLAPVAPSTALAHWDPLTLRLYPGNGSFTLYEDEGRNLSYQTGAWATTTFHLRQEPDHLLLEIDPRQGDWISPTSTFVIEPLGYSPISLPKDGQRHQLRFSSNP